MDCEQEYYAYQEAKDALDRYRREHFGGIACDVPLPEGGPTVNVSDVEKNRRRDELEAAMNEAKRLWKECRGISVARE